jgi:hypothetical protein
MARDERYRDAVAASSILESAIHVPAEVVNPEAKF